jgi:hypothetical protein
MEVSDEKEVIIMSYRQRVGCGVTMVAVAIMVILIAIIETAVAVAGVVAGLINNQYPGWADWWLTRRLNSFINKKEREWRAVD